MKKTACKKYARYVLLVFLTLVMIVNAVTAVLTFLEYNTDFEGSPYAVLTVKGGSMSPEFSIGDLIIVEKLDYDSLKAGDDVTFLTTSGLVTHRIEAVRDGEYITRGLANNTEDLYKVSEDTYCGKVLISIPYVGYALQFIGGSYIVIMAITLLLFAACFARPIINKIREKREASTEKRSFSIPARMLTCLCALSMLLCLPYVTDARYVGEINRFETVVAQPMYFSSNYLSSDSENAYNIQGWNGEPYTLSLQIQNYNNDLLYNEEGRNISYGFGVKIHDDSEYFTNYTVTITPEASSGVTPVDGDFAFPSEWLDENSGIDLGEAYQMLGGAKVTDKFSVVIASEGSALPADAKISFDIYAVTEQNKTYSIQLQGTFTFHVVANTDFISWLEVTNKASMVNLDVKTSPSNDGSGEKVVVFKWNPDELYLNEYQNTVFTIITKNPSYYNKEAGTLYMKLQPYSMVKLEFFKRVPGVIDNENIIVQVVDNIGDLPTAPTE